MPINPNAVGATGHPSRRSWTSKDALLYAVGVGAGIDELPFTTENTKDVAQRVLPTYAVIVGGGGVPMDKIGSFNPFLMVHGTQGIELLDEIPADGEIESIGRVTGIWDKGNAAVLEFESTSTNVATGKPLLKTRMSLFCRGEGGWGGDRGPSEKLVFPNRKADHQITYQTREDQALLTASLGEQERRLELLRHYLRHPAVAGSTCGGKADSRRWCLVCLVCQFGAPGEEMLGLLAAVAALQNVAHGQEGQRATARRNTARAVAASTNVAC